MTTYIVDPDREPTIYEIVHYCIASTDPDYETDWIPGELLLRVNCSDGIVLIYYCPKEK